MDTANGPDAPRVRPLPVGLTATGTRTERDSLGTIEVPADHYWGAQTQRSLTYFNIGDDIIPAAVYHAYGFVKKASAIAHLPVREDLTLRDAALASGVSAELYDEVVVPERLTRPGSAGSGTEPGSGAGREDSGRGGTDPGGAPGAQA